VAVAHVAGAQELGPLCSRLAGDLGLDPGLVDGFISSLPEPPATGFCTWYVIRGAQAASWCSVPSQHTAQ
jgi:hypothetical protein